MVEAARKLLLEKLAALSGAVPCAAKAAPLDERKLEMILLTDLASFTALSEMHDPEYVHSLMNDCFNSRILIYFSQDI
jgi:hypothetical protein